MTEGNPVPVNLPAEFEAVYSYRDPDGKEYARTYRYPDRCPDRKADPYRLDGEAWVHSMPEDRLPYRVETLNDDGRKVLIVEGEKCVEAAAAKLKNLDVIGWMAGASSVHKTDWHCLEGRHVILWPDADHAGIKVIWIMLKELQAAGVASYSIIVPEADRPRGWDCADALQQDGWDAQRIGSYLFDRKHLIWMPPAEVLAQLEGFKEGTPALDLLPTLEQLAAAVHDEPKDTCQAVREDALKIGKDRKLLLTARMVDASFSEFPNKRQAFQERLAEAFPKPSPLRVEPTPDVPQDPVDGVELANELLNIYGRFLWLEHPEDMDLMALWTIWTWFAVDGAECCPLLGFVSPEPECGKTRALELLHRAVKNPLTTANISASAMFRSIAAGNPTLLIDEADASLFGTGRASERTEELRGILNAGHTREFAYVDRAPREGGDGEKNKRFSVWGSKAYAAIGKIPETVRSRSITIRMRRKPKDAKVERWRASKDPVGNAWKERAERFAQDKMAEFQEADTEVLSFLSDREEDNARELLKVADLLGGNWPTWAREAVRSMKKRSKPEDDNLGNLLLSDIRDLHKAELETAKEQGQDPPDCIFSQDLDKRLLALEERPWSVLRNGKGISPQARGRMLNKYEIRAETLRDGPAVAKGYRWKAFFPAWDSYLDDAHAPDAHVSPQLNRYTVTNDVK